MEYPDELVLIARGKYSTLGKARREQLERARKIVTTLINSGSQALRDCEAKPPVNGDPLNVIASCLKNLTDARDKIVELCSEMESLKVEAGYDD